MNHLFLINFDTIDELRVAEPIETFRLRARGFNEIPASLILRNSIVVS
jgi:hypothetical protein